ncbi:hypothetical protein MBANPS3_011587 [Mucor bainieri]
MGHVSESIIMNEVDVMVFGCIVYKLKLTRQISLGKNTIPSKLKISAMARSSTGLIQCLKKEKDITNDA